MNDYQLVAIKNYDNDQLSSQYDSVVTEAHVQIIVNGKQYITIAASPSHLNYLSVGHLYTDGVIQSVDDVKKITVNEQDLTVDVQLFSKRKFAKKNQLMTTGFGKGTISLDYMEDFPIHLGEGPVISVDFIVEKMKEFHTLSRLFRQTGGAHSSYLYLDEQTHVHMDDIGRHNSVDKLLGYSLIHQVNLKESILMTSGRISTEIVSKIAKIGIPILISRSAATDYAIEMAKKVNMTLVGFVRGNRFNIYHDKNRILAYPKVHRD